MSGNQRQYVAIACLMLVTVFAMLAVLFYDFPSKKRFLKPPRADYVEIVSLTPIPDMLHAIPLTDESGRVWYRSAAAIVDLSDCYCARAKLTVDLRNRPAIVLSLRPEAAYRLPKWIDAHFGQYVAITVGDRPPHVVRLEGPVPEDFFLTPSFESDSTAKVVLERIKSYRAP